MSNNNIEYCNYIIKIYNIYVESIVCEREIDNISCDNVKLRTLM